MAVRRYDLNKCVGCQNCVNICPMDVFRFDTASNKSVIAYPENCQSCGQCWLNCLGRSLYFDDEIHAFALTASR
ncbi:MAG: 4Fe-4S binding protein [Lachnospiraceae bacterium]|nr:4Fe-4S binding protein [Lachnospiraceae bacterium]